MKNYVGTYRVVGQQDVYGNFTENKDDTYIPCAHKMQIFRFGENVLAIYIPTTQRANNIYKQCYNYLTEECRNNLINEGIKNKKGVPFSDGAEAIIYFKEQYIKEVAEIVKAKTLGASITPFSVKNLSREKNTYVPPNLELFEDLTNNISQWIEKQGGNMNLYLKLYRALKDEYSIDFVKKSREQGIRVNELIDQLGLSQKVIDFLQEFAL